MKIISKCKLKKKNLKFTSNIPCHDGFFQKNLSLKSDYPLNGGSLKRVFLTLEKPGKIRDQTRLSLKCGYPLNRGATKVGFHCIFNFFLNMVISLIIEKW